MIRARVTVTLKNGVLDPQGVAIGHGLESLGFSGVRSVRQGKIFDIEIDGSDHAGAKSQVEAMCRKLLANAVIEDFVVETFAR